jgi:hypothetical protein
LWRERAGDPATGRPFLFQLKETEMKSTIIDYVFARLREFSTWRGIAALAATGGVLVAPEQLDAAYKAFIALLGLTAVFAPNRK